MQTSQLAHKIAEKFQRLCVHVFGDEQLNAVITNTIMCKRKFRCVCFSGLAAAILDFRLPVTLYDICISFIELPVPGNMRLAVEIFPLSCLQAEMCAFPVWRPPSWISNFRLHCMTFVLGSLSCTIVFSAVHVLRAINYATGTRAVHILIYLVEDGLRIWRSIYRLLTCYD